MDGGSRRGWTSGEGVLVRGVPACGQILWTDTERTSSGEEVLFYEIFAKFTGVQQGKSRENELPEGEAGLVSQTTERL
jgi:hypothetical protein